MKRRSSESLKLPDWIFDIDNTDDPPRVLTSNNISSSVSGQRISVSKTESYVYMVSVGSLPVSEM